jgi:hypothetical protein
MEFNVKSKAAQEFVPIQEIRDGILLLKDGSLRAVMLASSLNFALKSQDEQTSIIYQFQNFLNSLNFSVQICVQSRKLNIKPYLAFLEERGKAQTTDLMKIQVQQYIEFVRTLTESTNIMTKSFFLVVPFTSSAVVSSSSSNSVSKFFGAGKTKKEEEGQEHKTFEESRGQLEQRVAVVEEGLTRCGVRMVELGTEELIELFYKSFNPGELEKPIHQA